MKLDCIVMAGGRGSRMGGTVKPLLEICGKPLILRVIEALQDLCKRIIVVYSIYTKSVENLCKEALGPIKCIEGTGDYIKDLNLALSLASLPVLVVPSDIPFLESRVLKDFITKALMTPEPIVNLVDVHRGPVGITLFKEFQGSWTDVIVDGGSTLLDVDTWDDYKEALDYAKNSRR